jgi:homoserine O-acetyltransferase
MAAKADCGGLAPTLDGLLRLRRFPLDCGLLTDDLRFAWQSWGRSQAPVVLVCGGISAGRDVASWWPAQCGPGRALDPTRLRLVSVDWLGGAGDSSGPVDDREFPPIESSDQALAILRLLDHLGIARVDAVVGASYGACVGQHVARLLGTRLRRLVVIGAAHRASPWALALRTLQRAGIEHATCPASRRMALMRARQLAVLGYRTPDELESRFGAQDPDLGVLGWLTAHGERFASRFSAASFLCLSRSLDHHCFQPETIRAQTTVVAIDGDLLVPFSLAREFVRRIGPGAELLRLSSPFGHDAFLKEHAAIGTLLRERLLARAAA